jgi:hypothetical protein
MPPRPTLAEIIWNTPGVEEGLRQERRRLEIERREQALDAAPAEIAEQLRCLYLVEDVLARVGLEPIVEIDANGDLVVWIQERDSQ